MRASLQKGFKGMGPAQVTIIIICIGILIAIVLFLVAQEEFEKNQIKVYSLTFTPGSTTFSLDNVKLAFTVDNEPTYPHILTVYGLNSHSNTQATIFASDFVNENGDIIDSGQIQFDNSRQLILDTTSNDPQRIDIRITDSKKAGSFQGWFILLIGADISSIPINASTPPMILAALLWTAVGILISIISWEIIKWTDYTRADKMVSDLKSNPIALANATIKVKAYEERLSGTKGKARVAIINIATAVFGLAVAFIGLLSNPFVTNLLTTDSYEKIVLIGLGLGIGSAKEIVDKI
jgi:hypothetical protein